MMFRYITKMLFYSVYVIIKGGINEVQNALTCVCT